MTAEQKIEWLNEKDPFHEWTINDDVYCLHCDGVFKVQDVACNGHEHPTCPVCKTSSVIDFHDIPWWREDLTVESEDDCKWKWRLSPIAATAGRPGRLPWEMCMKCGIPARECGCGC